jgi:hypothetical protein
MSKKKIELLFIAVVLFIFLIVNAEEIQNSLSSSNNNKCLDLAVSLPNGLYANLLVHGDSCTTSDFLMAVELFVRNNAPKIYNGKQFHEVETMALTYTANLANDILAMIQSPYRIDVNEYFNKLYPVDRNNDLSFLFDKYSTGNYAFFSGFN